MSTEISLPTAIAILAVIALVLGVPLILAPQRFQRVAAAMNERAGLHHWLVRFTESRWFIVYLRVAGVTIVIAMIL